VSLLSHSLQYIFNLFLFWVWAILLILGFENSNKKMRIETKKIKKFENWNNGNKDSPRAANKRCSTQSNLSEFQADFLLFMRFMLFNSPKLMPSRILKMAKRKKNQLNKYYKTCQLLKAKFIYFLCILVKFWFFKCLATTKQIQLKQIAN
jgi:hypothetical protein